MAITHTCSLWRNVSIRCSELWSTLYVDRMPRGLAALYAKRSGKRTLNLTHEPHGDLLLSDKKRFAREELFKAIWTARAAKVRYLWYEPFGPRHALPP